MRKHLAENRELNRKMGVERANGPSRVQGRALAAGGTPVWLQRH